MAKLSDTWWDAFQGSFQDEEDVIEFIFEHLDTKEWEDSYVDAGGRGEINERIKITAEDKKEILHDFMMTLINNK